MTSIQVCDFDKDNQMTFSERLSILAAQYLAYKNIPSKPYNHHEFRSLIRDMRDFLEDCEDEMFYRREILFLIYKLLNTPAGHTFLKHHKLMAMTAKIEAVEFLKEIYTRPSIDFMWRNTRNAIEDFLFDTDDLFD